MSEHLLGARPIYNQRGPLLPSQSAIPWGEPGTNMINIKLQGKRGRAGVVTAEQEGPCCRDEGLAGANRRGAQWGGGRPGGGAGFSRNPPLEHSPRRTASPVPCGLQDPGKGWGVDRRRSLGTGRAAPGPSGLAAAEKRPVPGKALEVTLSRQLGRPMHSPPPSAGTRTQPTSRSAGRGPSCKGVGRLLRATEVCEAPSGRPNPFPSPILDLSFTASWAGAETGVGHVCSEPVHCVQGSDGHEEQPLSPDSRTALPHATTTRG